MGFFSKIFKGVKKVFKKIGKGVKSVFKGIGKFMNKIGIAGQIALMFIPGIGPFLSGMLKGVGGMAATALNALGPAGQAILKGAKFVIGKAGKFAGAAKNAFRTVTDGIKTFASEFTKTTLNKIGFDPTKFGWKEGGSFDTWMKSGADQTFGDAWNKVTTNISENAGKILDPFRDSVMAGSDATLKSLSDSTYIPEAELKQLNPQISDWNSINGQAINLDPDNVSQVFGTGPLQSTADRALAGQPSLLDKMGLEPNPNFKPELEPFVVQDKLVPSGQTPSYLEGLEDLTSKGLQDSTVRPPLAMKSVPEVSATTEGGSLLGMPTIGEATTQVGVNVASQMAMNAIAGDPPQASYGEVIDLGYAPVYEASQQANFFQAAMEPYSGYRDPMGMYGSTANNTYAQYMRMVGTA